MASQVEQRNNQYDHDAGMHPTNKQVGGPAEFGSDPAQNSSRNLNQSRFNEHFDASNTDGYDASQQSAQQQHQPSPVHPSRADRNNQYGQTYDQDVDQNQPHTLDRRGHRGPGAKAHAAEAGAVAEGERLAHGGNHVGAHGTEHRQEGYGTGAGQNNQFATPAQQNQGISDGTMGHHPGNAPVRVAEPGATYEVGKLAHGHGHGHGQNGERFTPNVASGNRTGYPAGQGAGAAGTTTGQNVGQTAGQTHPHPAGVDFGTTAAITGGAGATHPGVRHGVGHETGAYNQQPAGTTTTGAPGSHAGGTTTAGTVPGTHPTTTGSGGGTGTGSTGPSVGSGQANVMLGKLQQAGGMLLRDDTMKAKGLEREARGVTKADQNEANRLEAQAQARREKALGTVPAHADATTRANAGVDPSVGTHGRNL